MALLRIDLELVEKLLNVRLEAIVGAASVSFIGRGRAEVEDQGASWVRIESIRASPIERQRVDGQTDRMGITVAVHCACGPDVIADNAYALTELQTLVISAIGEQRIVDSPLTHALDMGRAEVSQDGSDGKLMSSGAVMVSGVVQRVA